ncbi:MAG: outer membrane homotrimeric porin [Mailhella sp.]|nr:outer membrane homotrimeric porin [Mailhella sp.]
MKKIVTLALAAAFTVASYAPASAVDFKMDAEVLYQFQTSAENFEGENTEFTGQRIRLGMTAAASDNLSGYFQLQIGEDLWGTTTNTHGAHEEETITLRQAYIDWTVPGTDVKVRMGRHAFDMPSYVFCSPIITDYVGEGVVVALPVNDRFGLTGFWSRLASDANSSNVNGKDFDIFGLIGQASLDNVEVTPWAIYGSKKAGAHGSHEEQSTIYSDAAGDLFLAGAGVEWKPFDPFTFAVDAAWGQVKYGSGEEQDDEGWYVAVGGIYALDFAEPALKAWYASGDDKGERAMSGQLPSIFGDCDASNTFFNGAPSIVGGHRTNIGGTWGVSAQLNGLSFLNNLTHDLSITYIGGTNDKANAAEGHGYDYMTSEDSAIEFAAVNTLEIYKNLSAIIEAAYIIEDYDTASRDNADFENDWRLSLTFAYTF